MKEYITKEFTCPECDGNGYIIDVRATCCGCMDEDGNCCMVPDPEQYQKECNCNNGVLLIEEEINMKDVVHYIENNNNMNTECGKNISEIKDYSHAKGLVTCEKCNKL